MAMSPTPDSQTDNIKVVQINLQHNKAATAIMAKGLKNGKFDIAIIQEPYIYKEAIRGLGGTNGIIYTGSTKNARTCIYVRNGIDAWPLQTYNFRDLTAVKIHTGKGAEKRALIVTSAYLPYEERDPVHQKLRDLVDHSCSQNLEIIIGCDTNSHHTVWGSSNINKRGEKLLEYLASSPLQIMNNGNKPTFVNRRRGEVIDITLASNNASKNIIQWHVSDEITLSDHRYICFSYRTHHKKEMTCRRNPRNTLWDKYQLDLKVELGDAKGGLNSIIDIEFEADNIERAINKAWSANCPENYVVANKVPWWTKELAKLRQKTRTAFNRAAKTKQFDRYYTLLTEYSKAVRKAKRESWREHCGQLESLPKSMRLVKALGISKTNPLTTIRKENGELTESGKSTLNIMIGTHFPDSTVIDNNQDILNRIDTGVQIRTYRRDWEISKKVVDEVKLRWAIESFQPYKTPGPDMIYPILLQKGMPLLTSHLCRLFRACIAFGYTPQAWSRVRVVFLPKPGKDDYENPKSYRPISLSSFILKTLEKLVDIYIREGPLRRNPLHNFQCAYQAGRSTETALHLVTNRAETAIKDKICAGAFKLIKINKS
jgi:hypothetical protein